jgi:hypothetical protein
MIEMTMLSRNRPLRVTTILAALLFVIVALAACGPQRTATRAPQKSDAPQNTSGPAATLNALSPLEQTVQVEFGDRMQLIGVKIDKGALVSGEPLIVHLEWKSLAPIDGDLRAWISFIDENGEEVAGDDDVIGTRANPTSGWSPGATGTHSPRGTMSRGAQPKMVTIRAGVLETDRITKIPVSNNGGLEAGEDWVTIAKFGA